ncbi:hypothetical protein DFJ58DRAFT_792034, partial [Suillus subalutaceus]|uniref:uncharacterized protein n=1 Tax=Suillus subalutaceus TaxID=48586 RepID=UPI001B885B61
MLRQAGLWTRFWLLIGCLSPEYQDGHHQSTVSSSSRAPLDIHLLWMRIGLSVCDIDGCSDDLTIFAYFSVCRYRKLMLIWGICVSDETVIDDPLDVCDGSGILSYFDVCSIAEKRTWLIHSLTWGCYVID